MQLLIWLTETETGDLDEIADNFIVSAFSARTSPRWQAFKEKFICHRGFFGNEGRKRQNQSCLLTNHAYLVTRLEDNPEFVDNRLVILDEAQKCC